MNVSVRNVYTSVACNRTPEIVDWNSDGLICFGAKNAVVIYDTNLKGQDSLTVLSHHRSQVNSVKWVSTSVKGSSELLSCSADKTAAIWSLVEGSWKVTSTLTGHKDGITSIYGLYTENRDLIVCTASIDSTVKVWIRNNSETTLKQTISLNSGLCLTLHLHLLPLVKKPILFCALDDHKIHVFAGDEYHRVHTLVGHEDWVRGFDVLDVDASTILLASASQDTYIRIWRIEQHIPEDQVVPGVKVEEKVFNCYGRDWAVKLDAVLAGHEGWVYGVQWHPYHIDKETKKKTPVYRLLSSSLDKTLIVWEPETSQGEGVWVEKVRVGEVGGNGLGFYGSRFGPDGRSFLGHGYNGSFHIWVRNEESKQWIPAVVCGGHFNSVEDVRWEPKGRYIMSLSTDQTTRVHAPWRRPDGSLEWHEIARPQVHGYDMASLALVSSCVFASAAEEKVVRVFRAPHNFLQNFTSIVGLELEKGADKGPEGASVPSLGLSNKAVFVGDEDGDAEDDNDGYFVPIHLTEPPTEETLMQNSLWPESHKLYGHGYEVFALDASADGQLLASACKATTPDHAAPIIWETKTWQQIQKLVSHQLTVTQLAFSPDSRRLLSVSRDRRWTIYQRMESNLFEVVANTDKTNGVHTRIIWCCAWTHDSRLFATGSREGKVCVWNQTETPTKTSLNDYALLRKPLELTNTSITALSFAPVVTDGARVLAVGFESGLIMIYSFADTWSLLYEMDNSAAHHLCVKRLSFQPQWGDRGDSQQMLLASGGADHLVRIYTILLC